MATRVLNSLELEEAALEADLPYNHFDEVDQDNKAWAVNGKLASLPYTVAVIN